jgi:hypothetical protein
VRSPCSIRRRDVFMFNDPTKMRHAKRDRVRECTSALMRDRRIRVRGAEYISGTLSAGGASQRARPGTSTPLTLVVFCRQVNEGARLGRRIVPKRSGQLRVISRFEGQLTRPGEVSPRAKRMTLAEPFLREL